MIIKAAFIIAVTMSYQLDGETITEFWVEPTMAECIAEKHAIVADARAEGIEPTRAECIVIEGDY